MAMTQTVYGRGITSTSSTRTDVSADYGTVRYYKGNEYRLFKAGGTITAGAVCMLSAIDGTSAGAEGTIGETVVVTTGSTVAARCANDTGASIASGQYFWGLTEGYVVLVGDAALAAGETIMPTADGAVDTYVEADSGLGNTACGIALEDSPASPYGTTCFFKAVFGHNANA